MHGDNFNYKVAYLGIFSIKHLFNDKSLAYERHMFIAFDLDGTLADPSEGVTSGINHTLQTLGMPTRPNNKLLHYIGPPTEWIFGDVLQTTDVQRIEQARQIFTAYYRTRGFSQNHLYPDTIPLIDALNQDGHYLVVVTAKSDSGAKAAASHFKLHQHFKGVFGRVNDCSKMDSLKLALSTSTQRPAVMIGDRKFDVEAGKALQCLTVGVTYGFGSYKELSTAGPDYIVDSQNELLKLLNSL